MTVKPIKTEADYDAALARARQLMDARAGTPEGDELDLLATLIDLYEAEQFPIEAPTPLEAIRFRMEQEDLTPRDLEPYIGSRARVSEVLAGERALSIDMIRALNRHLGIPAISLIGAEKIPDLDIPLEPAKPVVKLLKKWRFMKTHESYESFFGRACYSGTAAPAMLRATRTERANAKADPAALQAWCAAVSLRAKEFDAPAAFVQSAIDFPFARHIASLSCEPEGPLAVRGELAKRGIRFVVVPHLPETYLDGAAMMGDDDVPIIALTLRRDRTDVFWFTLLHELAHVARHLSQGIRAIFDDLELNSVDLQEREADALAKEALIPKQVWNSAALGKYASTAEVTALAKRACVSVSVVAGRWQKENKDFRKFSKLIEHGELREMFDDELVS